MSETAGRVTPMRAPTITLVTIASLAALTGCSSGDTYPTAGCDAAMRALADTPLDAPDSDVAPLLEVTLDDCENGDDWIAALEDHPDAMGLTGPEHATPDLFDVVCIQFPDGNACP